MKKLSRFKRLIQGLNKAVNSTKKRHILVGKKDDRKSKKC